MLTPTGTFCEDAWLVTAALLRETSTLKFLVAFRPGVINPVLAAQMAAAYQRISGGRLLLNIVTGGEPREQARFGDTDPKATRYARTEEFLSVLRGTWEQPPFDFKGQLLRGRGRAGQRAGSSPRPDIYFGGSSGPAGPVAAKHADVYLTWGEPPELVAEKLDWMRSLAREQGRTLRFGLRVHTLSRDTSEDAWRHAQWLLDGLDPRPGRGRPGGARAPASRPGRPGCWRCATAVRRTSDARELEVSPGLWSGVGLVRGGAGTALVGSHDEVADRLAEYHALGIDEFILSGYPHVEEAYWFGEGVMPRLRERGLLGGATRALPQPVAASA